MNYLSESQLTNLTPCRLEALLRVINAKYRYYEAAEEPQYSRETDEREAFKRYRQLVFKIHRQQNGEKP